MNNNRLDNYTKEDLAKYGKELSEEIVLFINNTFRNIELCMEMDERKACAAFISTLIKLSSIMQEKELPSIVLDDEKKEYLLSMKKTADCIEKELFGEEK